MKRAALILAALAAILTAAAAPVRTATENFVTNKIAEAVAAIPAPDLSPYLRKDGDSEVAYQEVGGGVTLNALDLQGSLFGNYWERLTAKNGRRLAQTLPEYIASNPWGFLTTLAKATNYTDAALGAFAVTGAVARAEAYGTPTRWTDATGCVWEVSFSLSPWSFSGAGVANYSNLSVVTNEDFYVLLDNDSFVDYGSEFGRDLLEVHFANAAVVATRSLIPSSTNVVGRVALTNDIPDVSGYATTGAVAAVSSKVETLETWAIGDETSLTVREAGTTNATLEIAYTNKTLYASANEHTNTLNAAKAYTDGKAVEIAAATDAALAGKANRAWGETTSGGAPSPEDTLVIEKKKVALTGGGNFSYLESSTGGYWVMSISLGSTWTLESLADAQNPDVPATATFRDADGNAVYTVTSTGSREVYAVSGEQYIKVATVDGNDVITLTYPVATSEHPTSQYIPALEMLKTGGDYAEATAANWPDYIQSTAWSGQSGQWVCTITMKGCPGRGFFRAKYTKEGTVYTHFTKPLGLSSVTIGNVTYTVTVETVNGKKLMVLTEN